MTVKEIDEMIEKLYSLRFKVQSDKEWHEVHQLILELIKLKDRMAVNNGGQQSPTNK